MRANVVRFLVLSGLLLWADGLYAQTNFVANLDGSQENPPVVTAATGTATLTLNAAQNALSYTITITGLDLDGLQTPMDPTDDVTALHFHNAPPGVNGGVVFGLIGPGQDGDDLVINAAAGTVSGIWEETDPASSALSTQLADLLAGNLYLNAHTAPNPGGEIRGQILSAPSVLDIPTLGTLSLWVLAGLLVAAALWLLWRRGLG